MLEYRIMRYRCQRHRLWHAASIRISLLALFVILALAPALAVQPDEILKDPALESRARALSQELRCMVCQNQSIDDSDAPLARDLRILVRERLSAGDSDGQVISFLVARYGEFVLLKPPLSLGNALLWATPGVALILGGLLMVLLLRRRAASTANGEDAQTLSQVEEARLQVLLKDE